MIQNVLKVAFAILLCLTSAGVGLSAEQEDYYPSNIWRISTPEEQGIDSNQIYRMLRYVKKENINLHSIMMIRHGYLIHETYFHPFHRDNPQDIYSCTKSVISALVGIALGEGKIKSLDQKASDFFPEYAKVFKEPRKKELTIKHLLTMSTGFDWNEMGDLNIKTNTGQQFLYRTNNKVIFTLNRPMSDEPGRTFSYCSGASHLLSAIITKSTGKTTFEYANERLFTPLNMKAGWQQDQQGIYNGYANLKITPFDMSKLGYLYLKNGRWNDKQIIASNYIEDSLKPHIGEPFFKGGYGYQWWTNRFGGYRASGTGGQEIVVIPERDLIVVTTAGTSSKTIFKLMEKFILPAIQDQPLPENKIKQIQIKAFSEKLEYPLPEIVNPLPVIAKKISKKVFCFEKNSYGIESLSLIFKKGNECIAKVVYQGKPLELVVGLDEIYRNNQGVEENELSCRGRWLNANTFVLDWQPMSSAELFQYHLQFSNKEVNVLVKGKVVERNYRFKGKQVRSR
jgi:CubicO group peptidase (beta-lactamase class C family)